MPAHPPDKEEIRALAKSMRLGLTDEEEQALFAALPTAVQGFDRSAGRLSEPGSEDAAPKSGERDPWNAVLRRCSVARRTDGPLAGLRVGLKDTVAVAGVPLTAGSAVLEGYVPRRDATVTTRLREAGAEITAVLNMDDLALAPTGDTGAAGPVRNPSAPDRLCGGSSAGSAAALFGEVDLAIGGDQGGSIRIPASFCGCVGHKPTFGLVPYTGVIGAEPSIDHVGPMARTVSDTARLLDVLAGPDHEDPRQAGRHALPAGGFAAALESGTAGLRIGILSEGFDQPAAEPGVEACVRAAAARLAADGASVTECSVPAHREATGGFGPVIVEGVRCALDAEPGTLEPDLAEALAKGLAERAAELAFNVKMTWLMGRLAHRRVGRRAYTAAQRSRPALRAAYDAALAGRDLLLLPTTPMTAPPSRAQLGPLERLGATLGTTANTAPFDLSGHPACSVPCGEVEGRPVGLMLVGRHGDDATVLRGARAVERARA